MTEHPAFDSVILLQALTYAADKHRNQRRKDERQVPYINHPIEVAHMMAEVGHVTDTEWLAAAILHDTIEDTNATQEEVTSLFGERICQLVLEVSDDKTLPKMTRKQRQIEQAAAKSIGAKHITLADKTCNIRDLCRHPMPDWSSQRIYAYFVWAESVVNEIRGTQTELEALFDTWCTRGKERYQQHIEEPDNG